MTSCPRDPAHRPAGRPRRWTAQRKAALVIAVSTGRIDMDTARRCFEIAEEEFAAWTAAFQQFGLEGLKATRARRLAAERRAHAVATAASAPVADLRLGPDDRTCDFGLSPRQLECLRRVAAGESLLQIAAEFSVSRRTVQRTLATACERLKTVELPQAIAKAATLGLLGPEART
jgi:DNA-binding CsgD family transcriptional regulator